MMLPTEDNIKTITDLRERALELLNQTKRRGPTFILYRSKPKAVMLSIKEYAALMDLLEDYLDGTRARELELNPQRGGLTLVQLAQKYNLKL